MKFFDSVIFAGSYIFTNRSGATRGSCGTGGAKYMKNGLSASWPFRNAIALSAHSCDVVGMRWSMMMFVWNAALPNGLAFPDLPQCQVTYPASAMTFGTSGVPGEQVFARICCGQCQSDWPVMSMVRLGRQTAPTIDPWHIALLK